MAKLNLARPDNSRCYVTIDLDMVQFAIEYYKQQGFIVLSFLTVDNL